jgi:hypothetical protein
VLLRPRAPLDRDSALRGDFAEVFERPSLLQITGKGLDDGEVLGRFRRDGDVWDAFRGRRKRGEKRERKMADGVAEFRSVGSVPGIDGVEGFELGYAGVFDHADQIQSRIGESTGTVGEADQGKERARGPDFGIEGARSFESGESEDDVADGARTDEQSAASA